MRFLKSEGRNQRERQYASFSREDDPMHPEQLCDHDILFWRQHDESYYNFRREADRHSWGEEGVPEVRHNDQAGFTRDLNRRFKDMSNHASTFLRTSL